MKATLTILLLLLQLTAAAQSAISYKGETINALDSNNNQTGVWKLYDDAREVMLVCEFRDGEYIGDTKFYKGSQLIASYDNSGRLEIYKGAKTIVAHFVKEEGKPKILADASGKELDFKTVKYFYQAGRIKPQFYGGVGALYAFTRANFNSNGQKGKVKVQFYIDIKGFATDIEVIESSNPALNEEARRVISILPRWQPGYQGGDFVKCIYQIPINIE